MPLSWIFFKDVCQLSLRIFFVIMIVGYWLFKIVTIYRHTLYRFLRKPTREQKYLALHKGKKAQMPFHFELVHISHLFLFTIFKRWAMVRRALEPIFHGKGFQSKGRGGYGNWSRLLMLILSSFFRLALQAKALAAYKEMHADRALPWIITISPPSSW